MLVTTAPAVLTEALAGVEALLVRSQGTQQFLAAESNPDEGAPRIHCGLQPKAAAADGGLLPTACQLQ